MTEKDEAELKRIIGDLEVADAFVPSKEVIMFDVFHRFITRKQQELVESILREIPNGQVNVAQSDMGQRFKTVSMKDVKQSIKEKYGK